ncbi:Cycloserine biosynthesis protein DcsG [compost metagenome]
MANITFVASDSTIGDGKNPDTMDYFMGVQYPWLSLVIPELRKRTGKTIEVVNFLDSTVEWHKKECLILGPVWGYSKQQEDFDNWLKRIELLQIPMQNSVKFIRWNFQKTYLKDLQLGGLPVLPTIIATDKSNYHETMYQALKLFNTNDLIIKGVVDAAALGYRHIRPGDDFSEHFSQLLKNNKGAVIQPFLKEVSEKGELSFVFFGGKYSHCFVKVPVKNEERVQPFYGGKSFHICDTDIKGSLQKIKESFRPDLQIKESEIVSGREQVQLISESLAVLLQKKNIENPTYKRIDGVMVNGKFLIMEIEGLEPYMEMKEARDMDPDKNPASSYVQAILNKLDKENRCKTV